MKLMKSGLEIVRERNHRVDRRNVELSPENRESNPDPIGPGAQEIRGHRSAKANDPGGIYTEQDKQHPESRACQRTKIRAAVERVKPILHSNEEIGDEGQE